MKRIVLNQLKQPKINSFFDQHDNCVFAFFLIIYFKKCQWLLKCSFICSGVVLQV